jgi:hypothetical protein
MTADPNDRDACGCCAPIADPGMDNPPGASSLRFRIDTHAGFLARMLARIPFVTVDVGGTKSRPLTALTTRDPGDPSIAMLDAWAVVGDVLTFYQERIANEGFLGTATERLSIHALASAIGYELGSGVAAGTYLAFTLDAPLVSPALPPAPPPPIQTPSPTEITLARGTKVQSVPTPGQLPQTFETVEAVTARVAWNGLRARQLQRQQLGVNHEHEVTWRAASGHTVPCRIVHIDTAKANLNPGDWLILRVGSENRDPSDPVSRKVTLGTALVRVQSAEADPTSGRTRIVLHHAGHRPPRFQLPDLPDGVVSPDPETLDAATVRTRVVERVWSEPDLQAQIAVQGWNSDQLLAQVEAIRDAAPAPATIWVQRKTASAFGANAPDFETLPADLRRHLTELHRNWNGKARSVWQNDRGDLRVRADLFLDRVVDGLTPGGWVVLTAPGVAATAFQIRGIVESSLAEYAISGKATGLRLRHRDGAPITDHYKRHAGAAFKTRSTNLWLASEALPVGAAPLSERVGHAHDGVDHVVLDAMVLGLTAGQPIAVRGIVVDEHGGTLGAPRSEVAILHRVEHRSGTSVLYFEAPLSAVYDRATLTLCANVARATHGETIANEILGDGGGSAQHQAFALKRPPLTLVSAPTASGTASTLAVQVNGVTWSERDTLLDAGPAERVYQTRTDDTGVTTVTFGDGVRGARLPTGRSNVVATYRAGMGLAGEVGAGTLSLLASRPLGLRAVINPVAATGAADPEPVDAARDNAPRTVRTLDRIVSLSDYEDFARGFAGIGKARGAAMWDGDGRLVHVTVAAVDGGTVGVNTDLYRNLVAAIADLGDGIERFAIDSFISRHFALDASVVVAADRTPGSVLAAATAAVLAAYGFAARDLAEPVTESEIMAVLSGVPGVVAAFVTRLYRTDQAAVLNAVIGASDARWDAAVRKVVPAELLVLLPTRLHLSVVTP